MTAADDNRKMKLYYTPPSVCEPGRWLAQKDDDDQEVWVARPIADDEARESRILADAGDKVRAAIEDVVKAAKAYAANCRGYIDATGEARATHLEKDEEALHDAVNDLLAAERPAPATGDKVREARERWEAAVRRTHALARDPATTRTRPHGRAVVDEREAHKAYRAALLAAERTAPATGDRAKTGPE